MAPAMILDLPEECLRMILLHISILERIKLRTVCQRWKKVSDTCWPSMKILHIGDNAGINTVSGDGREVQVFSNNKRFITGVVLSCAPYLTALHDNRAIGYRIRPDFSIQRAMKSCTNLTGLSTSTTSPGDDAYLISLLKNNPKIRCFKSSLLNSCRHIEKLDTKYLAELSLHFVLHNNTLGSTEIANMVAKVIKNCQLLEKLTLTNICNDEILRAVGEKVNLSVLNIQARSMKFSEITADGWKNVFNLHNLQQIKIQIYGLIDNEFLINLSQSCVNLEDISLTGSSQITDDGFSSLRSLQHLKNLHISSRLKITNTWMAYFPKMERLIVYGDIDDTGAIELLNNSPNLQYLDLGYSVITIKTVQTANEVVQKRQIKIPLSLFFSGDLSKFKKPLSPLLQIFKTPNYTD